MFPNGDFFYSRRPGLPDRFDDGYDGSKGDKLHQRARRIAGIGHGLVAYWMSHDETILCARASR